MKKLEMCLISLFIIIYFVILLFVKTVAYLRSAGEEILNPVTEWRV